MGPARAELLTVVIESHGLKRTVRAAGELDLSTSEQLYDALKRAGEYGSGPVVLELQELTFIDASGLGAIARANHDLGERFSVASASPFVRRVLAITGLDHELRLANEAHGEAGESNVDYIRRLWAVWAADAGAFADLLPKAVELRPWQRRGTVLHGGGELIEFSRSPGVDPVQATSFSPVGDNVLIRLDLRCADGTSKEIWSLCQFDGATLVRAMNFDSRAEALEHAA